MNKLLIAFVFLLPACSESFVDQDASKTTVRTMILDDHGKRQTLNCIEACSLVGCDTHCTLKETQVP